ncbi:FRG domain-containing protein [Candidatus Neomarinimicrobiota bacterium]
MNPYFTLEKPKVIESVEELFSLNIRRVYYRPGDETPITDQMNYYSIPHSTSGIFRGQLCDWPLVPKSFRGITPTRESSQPSGVQKMHSYYSATRKFRQFCERAEVQNPDFPSAVSDRMSIAQHFGVNTPLLDWSQNILAAAFFATRDVYTDPKFEEHLKVFIYHIVDERHLHEEIPEESKLAEFGQSAYVKPHHIDKRIERQGGVFTYHPHPILAPPKIPVCVYVLEEWGVIDKLRKMMEGFGFKEDYFFPDYAGIARAVKSETSL